MSVRIGTAGWSIPRQHAEHFASEGAGLERYARLLRCAEINSTFYRSHRLSTYQRWAATVGEDFRFSVKAPKTITHECGLAPTREQMRGFVEEIGHLAPKVGPLLFQLPPRQAFDKAVARRFFEEVREEYPNGDAVLEPRHPSWFSTEAEMLLREFRIARVVADPPPVPEAARPGGDASLVYYRFHGSPRMYYSSYSAAWLERLAAEMLAQTCDVWCIFDNTASGAALGNALELTHFVRGATRAHT